MRGHGSHRRDGLALERYLDEIGGHELLTHADELALAAAIATGRAAADRLACAAADAETAASGHQIAFEFDAEIPRQQTVDEALVEAGAAARDRFVRANLRLVVSLARKVHAPSIPLSDLVQEGNIGLLRAVEGFDPERGVRFSTYAAWWIRQSMARHVAEMDRTIRMPLEVRELMGPVQHAEDRLRRTLGRAPSDAEIAATLRTTERRVHLIRRHRNAVLSLSAPAGDGTTEVGDLVADPHALEPSSAVAEAAEAAELNGRLRQLSDREQKVLRLRFGLADGTERTLAEIGDHFELTKERIRQIEEKALTKLRHPSVAKLPAHRFLTT